MNLIETKFINDLNGELKVKIARSCKKPLEFLVQTEQHKKNKVSTLDKKQIFEIAVEFFSPYASFLLYKIRDKKRQGDIDHRLLSAHIGLGMWDIMFDEDEADQSFEDIE